MGLDGSYAWFLRAGGGDAEARDEGSTPLPPKFNVQKERGAPGVGMYMYKAGKRERGDTRVQCIFLGGFLWMREEERRHIH